MRDKIKKFFVHKLNGFFPNWAIMQAKQDIAVKFDNYITIDLMGERSIGDQLVTNYNKETETYGGIREATLNIQAFGKGAVDCLAKLWLLLQRPMDVDECFDENLAVLGAGEVKDLTGLLDNRSWQERASVDLTVSFSRNVEYKIPFFDGFYNEPVGRIGKQNIYSIDTNVVISENDYSSVKKVYDVYVKNNEIENKIIDITITPEEVKEEISVEASNPVINSGSIAHTIPKMSVLTEIGDEPVRGTITVNDITKEFEYYIKKIEIPIELE